MSNIIDATKLVRSEIMAQERPVTYAAEEIAKLRKEIARLRLLLKKAGIEA